MEIINREEAIVDLQELIAFTERQIENTTSTYTTATDECSVLKAELEAKERQNLSRLNLINRYKDELESLNEMLTRLSK